MQKLLRAIRGATTVERNDAKTIQSAVSDLLAEMIQRNGIEPADLVCIFFSSTPDLNAAFPASGARELGLLDVPLFGTSELGVEGALDHCVRIMVQCYSARSRAEIRHVYVNGATVLRTDLVE